MESLPACAKDVQLFCYCGKFIRPRNCWKRQSERSRSDSGATLDQTSEASRCSYAFFSHANASSISPDAAYSIEPAARPAVAVTYQARLRCFVWFASTGSTRSRKWPQDQFLAQRTGVIG